MTLAGCLLAAAGALAHPTPQHPLGPATLIATRRDDTRVVLRARFGSLDAGLPASGVTVRVTTPGAGAPLVETILPPSGWQARRGRMRYRDGDGSAAGVRALALRERRRGARLVLKARGAPWQRVFDATAGLDVLVRHERATWCASFAGAETKSRGGRRLVLRAATAPGACPCEPAPSDTWDGLQRRLFARHACTQPVCHGNVPGSGGLTLVRGAAYTALVGVPSMADDMLARVEPGAPELSMLWRKLAARTLSLDGVPGTPMPIGDPPLDPDELAALAAWIAAGAPETGSVPAADALLGFCAP